MNVFPAESKMLDVLPDTRPEAGLLIIFRIWDYGDQEIIHIAKAIHTKDLNYI